VRKHSTPPCVYRYVVHYEKMCIRDWWMYTERDYVFAVWCALMNDITPNQLDSVFIF